MKAGLQRNSSKTEYQSKRPCGAVVSLSHAQLSVTPQTVDQAPLTMGFPRQGHWSGLPFPSPQDLPHPGIKLTSAALAGGFFTTESPVEPGQRFTGGLKNRYEKGGTRQDFHSGYTQRLTFN